MFMCTMHKQVLLLTLSYMYLVDMDTSDKVLILTPQLGCPKNVLEQFVII